MRIVREIEETLLDLPSGGPADGSLVSGDAGIALFHGYLARSVAGGADAGRVRLERAVETLATTRLPPDLYGGFTGIAWAVEHLKAHDPGEADLNEAIDDAIEEGFRVESGASWLQRFELLSGLAGLGLYALERAPRPSAVGMLERIVRRLGEMAERTAEGAAWRTGPEQLPSVALRKTPDGHYNLGVAHGSPGVIAVLAQACAAGIAARDARELLEDAVRWLRSRRLPRGPGADFPAWIASSGSPPADRVGWCYGNPGIAVAWLLAARALGEQEWEAEALELARKSAARPISDSRVSEACLCHGSAGNGHLFNRLFQATGDERFREAALTWFEHTVALQKPGTGLAGFESLDLDADGREVWLGQPGFLTGIAGIGLALLAATSPVEPAWDRLLVASLPATQRLQAFV